MANKQLFNSSNGNVTTNEAGGNAYQLEARQALAQLAVTGCMSNTYYTTAQEQLDMVQKLAYAVDNEFLAKVAIYSRKHGFMKDMPALLTAVLSAKEKTATGRRYFPVVFSEVCDNAKMVRNFVQIVRSGVTGRKSFGTQPKRLISNWFNDKSEEVVFRSSIGQNPTIGDVIKMVHPKPKDNSRESLFGYLTKRDYNVDNLPQIVKDYEAFKQDTANTPVPNVSFEMLVGLGLSKAQWIEVARNCTWTQARMSLNTFKRHGVFDDAETVNMLAERISNAELIKRAKAFPYQLMTAYLNVTDMPPVIKEAFNTAMEIACDNIPVIEGQIYLAPDVSRSMASPITGYNGKPSLTRCVDVAALVTSAILKKNPDAVVLPFDTKLHIRNKNFYNGTIIENARVLAQFLGGGTYGHLPLEHLNETNSTGSVVIYVSDNQSFIDTQYNKKYIYRVNDATATLKEWNIFKKRNKGAKLICIDIQPYDTTQTQNRQDILNVGGFSDRVFDIMSIFINSNNSSDHFINIIEDNITLE